MILEKIGNLCKITSGGTPSRSKPEYFAGGNIPWVKTGDLGKKNVTEPLEKISTLGLQNSSAKIFPANTVLVAMYGATIGSCAILSFEASTNQACAAFLPSQRLNHEYLYYFLKSIKQTLISMGKGGGQPNISAGLLKDVEIPLLDLDDQIRIAHLLGKVEGLIAQRKQHLQQLDDLIKSVFLEMFGDPILNPHGFPSRKLSEFYVNPKHGTKCGPFGSALKKEEIVDSGVPVWNMDNIAADGRMVQPFRMWITLEKYDELLAYSVQEGDIIISRAGTVGKMCVARMEGQPAIISTNLIRLRLGADLRPLHFVSLMLYCKGRVGRLKTGPDGTFTHMSTGVLDSLEFPYPPIELQDRFGVVAAKVESVKFCYQQSLSGLEALYGALSQQAFKGELDLSRVALPAQTQHIIAASLGHQSVVPEPNMHTLPAEQDSEYEDMLLLAEPNGSTKLLRKLFDKKIDELAVDEIFDQAFFQLDVLGYFIQLYSKFTETYLDQLEQGLFSSLENITEGYGDFGITEYEQLKKWIYDHLQSGKLKQIIDEFSNDITLVKAN